MGADRDALAEAAKARGIAARKHDACEEAERRHG
jgi:hypothetical protein